MSNFWLFLPLFWCLGCGGAETKPMLPAQREASVPAPHDSTRVRIMEAAKKYLGRPYVAGVLNEADAEEHLIIDTMRLDCWTFTEYCLAEAWANASEPMAEMVQKLRYRQGQVDGYGSRLHYFTEWSLQAQELGIVRDITQDLGGKKSTSPINYMSQHKQFYPLIAFGKCEQTILASERRITGAERYFIPKSEVALIAPRILSGLALAATIALASGGTVRRGGQDTQAAGGGDR